MKRDQFELNAPPPLRCAVDSNQPMKPQATAELPALAPWCAGGKLPWRDPAFRRQQIISEHVDWLHREVLEGRPSRILDLGCGPGLYTERLARLGHTCVGVDFSPAAIKYARTAACREALACEYIEEDLTVAEFGRSFDFAMFLFGELNAFPAAQAKAILRKTWNALAPGGQILLELFDMRFLIELGAAPKVTNTIRSGVFSAQPYTRTTERRWFAESKAVVERHIITDLATRAATTYANTLQAYTQQEYESLLRACGFFAVSVLPSLGNAAAGAKAQHGLCALLSRKPALGDSLSAAAAANAHGARFEDRAVIDRAVTANHD
jgi:2-polyprenyl-3-methyl-5-hydroxy-6-metoxy-1,4-benzoquinol methylase